MRPRKGDDGRWHAWVTVGTKPNGRPDQRHVNRETKEDADDEIDRLLDQRRTASVTTAGRKPTVEQWMTTYLDTIAPRRCDPGTVYDYRSKCRNWLYPVVGKVRVDRLTADQLDGVYLAMERAGKAGSSQLKLHRIVSRALEIALRRKVVPRNVAKLLDAPTSRPPEIESLTVDEALAILAATDGRRNAARWSVGLALGLRQGEAIGLRWQHVDLADGYIKVWWQLRRRIWEHGCGGSCGRKRGGNCPDRTMQVRQGETLLDGGLILKEPKGKSKRVIPLPAELVEALKRHREIQDMERAMAGGAWRDLGLVFTQLDGGPVDPGVDYDEWKALLAAAGVRDARVHDARHTAATLMLAQGVKIEVVQEVLGHSDIRTTRGYSHVASALARDATQRMGSALLRRPGTPGRTP